MTKTGELKFNFLSVFLKLDWIPMALNPLVLFYIEEVQLQRHSFQCLQNILQ